MRAFIEGQGHGSSEPETLEAVPAPLLDKTARQQLPLENSAWAQHLRNRGAQGPFASTTDESWDNSCPNSIRRTHFVNRPKPKELEKDVIDSGLLTIEDARRLFIRYTTELAPKYPSVTTFPKGTTADQVREEKPILFLSIITVAAASGDQQLYSTLDTLVTQTYAEQIMVKGRKSIDIIQALLVSVVWNTPPKDGADTTYYLVRQSMSELYATH